jgi:glycosyltransferase involved in cell wall biosynthesis
VHTHGLTSLFDVGQLAMLRVAPPWVHTFHFGNYPYPERRYMLAERFFASLADQLVAVSDKQRQDLIRHHSLPPQRIVTIPNGVPANPHVGDVALRARVRAEFGIPKNAPLIGTVAVLSEQKGTTYLLQAAERIHRERPDVRFLIVGGGPLESHLRAEAAARGLSSVVIFSGARGDVPALLNAFDVFVMASLWEAMPLALLEAMAARLPIVVTDVGQNRAIVKDAACGVVVAPRDVAALATAIRELLVDRPKATQLAAAALRRMQQEFTTARMVERYEALYERLRERPRR